MTDPNGARRLSLGDHAGGRDNNFDAIRLFCALTVLVGHAATVSPGMDERGLLHIDALVWAINAALEVFFVLSGYLITASMLRTRDPVRFGIQRIGRIVPGLAVASVFAAFVVGPLATTVPLADYFSDPSVAAYVPLTATTYPDASLPGVFVDHDLPGSINEPIWTLRYEVLMYGAVLAVFLAGLLRPAVFALAAPALLAAYLADRLVFGLHAEFAFLDHLIRFALAFGLGAAAWMFRDRVPLSVSAALVLVALAILVRDGALAQLTQIAALGYGALLLAYVTPPWRAYNARGDFSYGVYIYHWPIASLLYATWPALPLPIQIGLTAILTAPFAIASWYGIEAPALRFARALGRTGAAQPT